MSTDPRPSVRIVANANRKNQKTVNVVASADTTKRNKEHTQVLSDPSGRVPTYQASGGTVAGLKTIRIVGYVGPS